MRWVGRSGESCIVHKLWHISFNMTLDFGYWTTVNWVYGVKLYITQCRLCRMNVVEWALCNYARQYLVTLYSITQLFWFMNKYETISDVPGPVCSVQYPVSSVQCAARERERGRLWSQMAPLPLINPCQGLATLGFTQHTAHWLLSVSHWTQHTEHCTQWLWSTPTHTHSQLHYFIGTQSSVLTMHGL